MIDVNSKTPLPEQRKLYRWAFTRYSDDTKEKVVSKYKFVNSRELIDTCFGSEIEMPYKLISEYRVGSSRRGKNGKKNACVWGEYFKGIDIELINEYIGEPKVKRPRGRPRKNTV